MRFLLALDFDATITIDDHIPKVWGDRLAKKIRQMQSRFPMLDIFILSAANKAHIFQTTSMSGSTGLLLTLMDIPMITNEINPISRINHDWKENSRTRKQMIEKLTHIPYVRNNIEFIVAYKKTNYLIYMSTQMNIPHSHVYLLDDNPSNIHFASYHGFHALSINNHDKYYNIFKRLDEVIKSIQTKLKLSKEMA